MPTTGLACRLGELNEPRLGRPRRQRSQCGGPRTAGRVAEQRAQRLAEQARAQRRRNAGPNPVNRCNVKASAAHVRHGLGFGLRHVNYRKPEEPRTCSSNVYSLQILRELCANRAAAYLMPTSLLLMVAGSAPSL